jgi:hypothetical protein
MADEILPVTIEEPAGQRKMELGDEALKTLNKTRKWTMFLAVCGFIFLGLIIVIGLLTGTFLSAFYKSSRDPGLPDLLLVAGFIVSAVLNFFPVFFLYRFSTWSHSAVTTRDPAHLLKALRYLKRFFIFIGALIIAAIVSYIYWMILLKGSPAVFTGN